MINPDKLLKLSSELICTLDAGQKFVYISDAVKELLGYIPLELHGKLYTDIIDLADTQTVANALEHVIVNEKITTQNLYIHKSGHVVSLRWSAQWDKEDQLFYIIATGVWDTAREEAMGKSLEDSNQRYRYVIKATYDAIWDWDIIKGTLYWGENFERIFGYKRKNISPGNESLTAYIHPDDAARVSRSIQTHLKSKKTNWKEEYRYRKADGTYADVVDRGFVIRDKEGLAIRMVGAVHDMSERVRAMKEMKRISDDLYKRNRELQEFGYIVSHNLRSPVANIMGIASLLEIEKDDPETVSLCTGKLLSSIARLDEVILDLSKILNASDSSVELTIEPVDLGETIHHIQSDLTERILKNNARIDILTDSFIINSHKAYIYSIFFNLITNSIKYRSAEAPVISVKIWNKGKSVRITLCDNGCGIDLKRHGDDLFKPYKRFNTAVEGKGLGLFLVKSHIDVLGGTLEVTSKSGKGTSFVIVLPINRVQS